MEIGKIFNIKDEYVHFKPFINSLIGSDYVVSIEPYSFDITQKHILQVNDLKAIPDDVETIHDIRKVIGTLEEASFCGAQECINYYLSYVSEGVFPEPSKDSVLVTKRAAQFWSIVNNIIQLPPTHIYRYEPNPATRFKIGFMWNIVFIFVTGNKGLFIAMGATD